MRAAAPAPPAARWRAVAPGAVFLASGASLAAFIATGAPLVAALTTLAAAGGLWASRSLGADDARAGWASRVRAGVVAGLAATAAYDASRWAVVELGDLAVSPFAAIPLFGQALLGGAAGGLAHVAGVAFHLLNGVCFAIAYTLWFGTRGWRAGVAFALGLEACMLAVYPGWLDVASLREFTR